MYRKKRHRGLKGHRIGEEPGLRKGPKKKKKKQKVEIKTKK